MSKPIIIPSTAVPPQILPPMPAGATSINDAGIKIQQQQAQSQTALAKTGGFKRKMRGGAVPLVQVPNPPSYAVNKGATQDSYTQLTKVAQDQQTGSTFDNAKTPADTAALQAQQQSLYSGTSTGGSKKRIRGGSWPVWGCLSGGKQSRKGKSRKGRSRGRGRGRGRGKSKKTKRYRH